MIKHKGLSVHRLSREPLEAIYARHWQSANGQRPGMPHGVLEYLLGDGNQPRDVTQAEATIAATVIQWLGSPVGQCFVRECLEEAGWKLSDSV